MHTTQTDFLAGRLTTDEVMARFLRDDADAARRSLNMTRIIEQQASRELSAAIAEFWRASDGERAEWRRRFRLYLSDWRRQKARVAELHAAWVRADRAANPIREAA